MSEAEGGDSSQNDPDTQAYTLSPVCFTHQVHPHLLNRSHSVSSTSTWTSSCSHPAVNQHMEQYLYPEQRANDTATTSLTLSSVDGHSPAVAFATFAGQSVNSANPDSGKTAGGQSVISGFARAYEGRPVQLEPAPPGKQHTSSTSTPSSSYTQNYHYTPSSYLPSIVPLKAPPSRANGRNVESSCSSSTLLPGITASCSRPAQGVDYGHQEGNRLHNTAGTQSSGAHSPSTEWPREDILSLLHVLNEVDGRSWTEIAKRAFVDDKYTASQCQAKWREISKERKFVNRGPWRFEEDQALLEAIQLLGAEKWVVIATQVGARNGKQCRERWHNHLSPSIKKGPFTAEEDETIFHWYSIIGSRWSEIAKHVPGRPDNMIKNHINTSLQRQRRRQRTKQVDKDAKIVAKSSSAISGTNKAADRTETTSRSWSDSLEDSMHPTRIIDRSLSVDRLPHLTTMPMSKSSSSSSATSYSTPVDALARSVSLESAATGTTSLDSSISETTLSLSDEDAPSHRHPMPSPTKSLSGACLASPTLPTRGTSEYRIAYHPYARGMHAAPRYTPQGHCSNPGNPTVPYSAPVYQAIRQRTRPTTPEMKGHLSYQHPVTELVDDVPASAPSSMQYFDVLPTTPARRATIASLSPSSVKEKIAMPRSPILETSPVTSATHAMQTMVFGQHADFPSPDASSVPSLQGSEKATTPSPAASMQAPRAMHLSSLLSNSADNSPILDPGLKTSQMYTFATPHMPENSSSVLAHQAQFDLASTTSFNPSLCPHQQPHPSQYCYGTPGDTAIYYVPRHDSIVSPSETASAGLMSPMSIFHSPQAFSEGLPSATFSVASHNTVLTSPASSATYSETYARKNSTAASPGLARSEMSYASEQYAFHQVAHSRPFASGAGSSSYFATSPVESIQTSLTRAGAIPGVHSSSSDVFSAPSAARGSQAWHWVSNPGESESKQSIRAEQGDYMHQDS